MTQISSKMVEDLKMLKKVHDVYLAVDEERRGRLLLACEPIIQRLVGGGMERVFVESLIIGGKDFLDSLEEGGVLGEMKAEDCGEIIFS